MANLWDTMSEGQRGQLVRAYVGQQGNRSNENANRAREQLSANPNLVQRIAKEEGLIDEAEDQLQEGGGESEIERNVAASLEEPEGDNQATGQNSRAAIPPAESGESMEDYITRLSSIAESGPRTQTVENDNGLDRNYMTSKEKIRRANALDTMYDDGSGPIGNMLTSTRDAVKQGILGGGRDNDNKSRRR